MRRWTLGQSAVTIAWAVLAAVAIGVYVYACH